jgi:hypothetical protein
MDLPPLVAGFLQAIAAGIGARVTLSIGGKMAMPAIPRREPAAEGDRHGQDHLQRISTISTVPVSSTTAAPMSIITPRAIGPRFL